MDITVEDFLEANQKFNELEEDENKQIYEVINGKIPVLISAPHSVRQYRNGKIKEKDLYTGPIVIELQRLTNCYCIYKTKNNNDDANYDIENNSYKEEILKIIKKNKIKLLIDIHGASNKYGFGIDIGTGEGKNLNNKKKAVEILKNILERYEIENIEIDKIFKANSIHTICKTISEKTMIPCIEIEIAKKYRDIENFEELTKMILALRKYIKEIVK